ncbi:MAG: hypothetical protein AAFR01_14575 [Pseudomonadota bacterium]
MRQRILNLFRRVVLSRTLTTLSLKEVPAAPAFEPSDEPDITPPDDWMFDAAPALETEVKALSDVMGGLGSKLSSLHALVGEISATAPTVAEAPSARLPESTVWADPALFEGEPAAPTTHASPVDGDAVFLFETPETTSEPLVVDQRIQLPLPAPHELPH